MIGRVQVNEQGEFFIILPDEIVEDLQLHDGERCDLEEVNGTIEVTF